MTFYRVASLALAVIFAAVGILFMTLPDGVITFFNTISSPFGMPDSPLTGFNFYLVLAAGYMYVVTVLAFMMYRFPEKIHFPLLLTHAKFASSVLALALFLFQTGCLIYITNFIVDAFIGFLALGFYLKMRRDPNCISS